MTYSIVTIGGTVIESRITKEEAENFLAENGSYYSAVADEIAADIESAPTFEEAIGAMEKPVTANVSNEVTEGTVEAKGTRWNEVINEGGEGYQSSNW